MRTALAVAILAALTSACGEGDPGLEPGRADGAVDALDAPAAPDAEADAGPKADAPEGPDGPAGLAVACGVPGKSCCSVNRCEGGGCCVLGRCFAGGDACPIGGTCAEGSCGACGGVDQPCCPGEACTAEHTTCRMAVCRRCGELDQPCCPGTEPCQAPQTRCESSLQGTVCVRCGTTGQPCCPDGSCHAGGCCLQGKCLEPDASCGEQGTCTGGACSGCGGPGQPCCPGAECRVGQTCRASGCQSCGAPGQPCCRSPSGANDGCEAGAICDAVDSQLVCTACGGPGQRCCPDSRCAADACCVGGRCFGPGEICQVTRERFVGGPTVTTTYGRCQGGRCDGCGRAGMPCCLKPIELISDRRAGLCDAGTTCLSDAAGGSICAACGGAGQICCDALRCDTGCCLQGGVSGSLPTCAPPGATCSGASLDPAMNTCSAISRSCGSCGGLEQPCCSGNGCIGSARCDGSVCRSCGELGEICCGFGDCASGLVCAGRCVFPR